MGYAIRSRQGRVLVYAMVIESARAFFWIPVLAGVTYESFINGIIGGVVTLLVGLGVWLGLAVVLFFFTVGSRISKTVADVGRMQQGFPPRRPPLLLICRTRY